MERWAKSMKKKEARATASPIIPVGTTMQQEQRSARSADIGYALFEKRAAEAGQAPTSPPEQATSPNNVSGRETGSAIMLSWSAEWYGTDRTVAYPHPPESRSLPRCSLPPLLTVVSFFSASSHCPINSYSNSHLESVFSLMTL